MPKCFNLLVPGGVSRGLLVVCRFLVLLEDPHAFDILHDVRKLEVERWLEYGVPEDLPPRHCEPVALGEDMESGFRDFLITKTAERIWMSVQVTVYKIIMTFQKIVTSHELY